MRRTPELITSARAEALFTSDLPTGSRPTQGQATTAIQHSVHDRHGVRGCAVEVAGAYGDHPEAAVGRMRWALDVAVQLCAHVAEVSAWLIP
jgi:hypothetical protein